MFVVYEIKTKEIKYIDTEEELMRYLEQYDYFEIDDYVEIHWDPMDRNKASQCVDPHDYM